MANRSKRPLPEDSPWVRANRPCPGLSRFLRRGVAGAFFLLAAGLFCWMAIEEPARRGGGKPHSSRSGTGLPDRWRDDTNEQADRIMKEVQTTKAAGREIGIVDGTAQLLSPEQARRMVQAHRIREAIRNLRAAYLSTVEQKKVVGSKVDPQTFDLEIEAARGRAVAELKKCPAEEVAKEIEAFRPYLGFDAGALALFQEVEHAIGR